MEFIDATSPNFDARIRPPDMILLHYTGMPTGQAALERLRDPAARVSAHYLVEEDGRVFRLVAEERRAWHAGKAGWGEDSDINGCSIGVELVNPGHEFGYRAFPEIQIAALAPLMEDIRQRWLIPDERILGHADVAPERKQDPGELFPWRDLAQAGHGLFLEPQAAPGAALAEGDNGPGVLMLRAALRRLGYRLAVSDQFDAATALVVTAFQRHWSQQKIDGVADGATRARLIGLLRMIGDGR